MIKDRKGNTVICNEGQNKILKLLYGNIIGRMLLKLLTLPLVSKAAGIFMNSEFSVFLINPFIRKNGIDMSRYRKKKFSSYNDFFTRKMKRSEIKIDKNPQSLISPCDSKLSVYEINEESCFEIKNSLYRVQDLLKNKTIAEKYTGGYCMIFRLCVDDYHRYCYIDKGYKGDNIFIKGELHTVNPIALEHCNIYKRNSREYTVLTTENFGDVVQVEVGALLVGKIRNRHGASVFSRGDEKGKFEFGGSTIVLLFEKDRVRVDEDILENSANGCETIVKYGERIGVKY